MATNEPGPFDDLAEPGDPHNVVYSARVRKRAATRVKQTALPRTAFSKRRFAEKRTREKVEEERPRERVHPVLRQWLDERRGEEAETILVTFRDDLIIPRFPEPVLGEPRDSDANRKAAARADELARRLEEYRADDYKRLVELLAQHGAEVLETFWLVRAVLVKMPLESVLKLEENEDVLYQQPQFAGEPPPQDANANNDVDDGRARIRSDPYFNLGLTGGFIGLLDTGIRPTHNQFNSPSNIAFRRDCVNGGADCNTGAGLNPNDDCWDHGTASAAIISGNGRMGGPFRGVTGVTLDSFKVYPTSFDGGGACNGGLDSAAAIRGFQTAVRVLDRVIVAEMQGGGDDLDAICIAAENAFDAGAVIIAANGNFGPNANTVRVPAIAHRVIGVGNFDVQSQNQITGQSRGPAPDNRFKPDVQAPTNTETASNASDTALGGFGGTSGATPYAAGAAALLRNWLRSFGGTIEPGQVYAQLILSGQRMFPFDNTSGAGPLRLPTDGWAWWGKVIVTNGTTVSIPIQIASTTARTLDAALWWPESVGRFLFFRIEQHNDIDLALIDPSGVQRASSISIPSVFERCQVPGTVATGTWRVRIRGFRVESSSQAVYWAAHVRL